MKNRKIFIILSLIVLFASCSDYLDPFPNGDRSRDNIWEYQAMVQGLVGQCYDYMPRNYNDNEGAYLDCATDNAVRTSTTDNMRRLAVGAITTGQDVFRTYWDRDYKALNLLNMFLEDGKGYNTRFLIDPEKNDLVRKRLQGEAFALRAWFQWDLLQKFGGEGMDGQLLGYPIVTEPLDFTQDIDLPRDTYEACVNQIVADCDSAYKYLAIAHRDFLVDDVNHLSYAGARYWGRMDGITTRAIKALVYLNWASPRFNPGNDVTRWEKAAQYAKEVMDFKVNVDGGVSKGFKAEDGVNWFNPNFPGIVWASRPYNSNDAMERMFYPGGFQGDGRMGATQELVDAFPMANGYPIDHPDSGYDPANPYQGRDPRFYSMIFHNDAKAVRAGKSEVMYTFENWGKDAAGASSDNSRTNYHIKKFVWMGLNWSDKSPNRQAHGKFYIRWAHMVLAYAEAINQVSGPTDASKFGLSAKDAMMMLRSRESYDGDDGFTADPYLDEVAAAGKEAFYEFIKNERRIETCFEGLRFWDIRRWDTPLAEINKPVHGTLVTANGDGSFSYDLNYEIEPRSYPSPFIPIPYNEVLRMDNLVQNKGWDSWK